MSTADTGSMVTVSFRGGNVVVVVVDVVEVLVEELLVVVPTGASVLDVSSPEDVHAATPRAASSANVAIRTGMIRGYREGPAGLRYCGIPNRAERLSAGSPGTARRADLIGANQNAHLIGRAPARRVFLTPQVANPL